MTIVNSATISATIINSFVEATYEDTWASFEVFRRFGHPADAIFVVVRKQPAPHVVVSLMSKGPSAKSLFDLYVGRVGGDVGQWLAGWKTFAEGVSAADPTVLQSWWAKARVNKDTLGLAAAFMKKGLIRTGAQ